MQNPTLMDRTLSNSPSYWSWNQKHQLKILPHTSQLPGPTQVNVYNLRRLARHLVCVLGAGQQEHVSHGAGLCPKLRHRGHWMETAQKKHRWEANMVKWLIGFLIRSEDSPSGFHSTWTHGFCVIIFKGVLKMHFSNTAWFFRQGNTFCIQPKRSGIQKCPLYTVMYFTAMLTERRLKGRKYTKAPTRVVGGGSIRTYLSYIFLHFTLFLDSDPIPYTCQSQAYRKKTCRAGNPH